MTVLTKKEKIKNTPFFSWRFFLVFIFLSIVIGGSIYYSLSAYNKAVNIKVAIKQPKKYSEALEFKALDYLLRIVPIAALPAKAQAAGENKKIYKNAYLNTDVEQETDTYKLKETLIFSEQGHPLEFKYDLGDLSAYEIQSDYEGNLIFYDKKYMEEAKLAESSDMLANRDLHKIFSISAPFLEDKNGIISRGAVQTEIDGNILILKLEEDWLADHPYPIKLDPTVSIEVINVHSLADPGNDWRVQFTTQGAGPLSITLVNEGKYAGTWAEWPEDDLNTLDDLKFVELYADGQPVEHEKIFDNEGHIVEIKVADWHYGEGELVNTWLLRADHAIKFDFNGAVAYAYNAGIDSYTVLMLHMDGSDEGTTFTDNSASAHAMTASGQANTEQSVYKFSTASLELDGSGDFLTTPDSDDWAFGSGNFTIDGFIRFSSGPLGNTYYSLVSQHYDNDTRWHFGFYGPDLFFMQEDGVDERYPFNTTCGEFPIVNSGTWYHVAFVRNGGTGTLYFNGASQCSGSWNRDFYNQPGDLYVGSYGNGNQNFFPGYIDEFRISKGIARWIGSFTPPTSAYTSSTADGGACSTGADCYSGLCVAGTCRAAGSCVSYPGSGCSTNTTAWNNTAAGTCLSDATCDYTDPVVMDCGTACAVNTDATYASCSGRGSDSCDSDAGSGNFTQNGMCYANASTNACSTSGYIFYDNTYYVDDGNVAVGDYDWDINSDGMSCDSSLTSGGDYAANGMITYNGSTGICTSADGASDVVRKDASVNNYFVATCDSSADTCDTDIVSHLTALWSANGICASNTCDTDEVCNNEGSYVSDCSGCSALSSDVDACDSDGGTSYGASGICTTGGTCSTGTVYDNSGTLTNGCSNGGGQSCLGDATGSENGAFSSVDNGICVVGSTCDTTSEAAKLCTYAEADCSTYYSSCASVGDNYRCDTSITDGSFADTGICVSGSCVAIGVESGNCADGIDNDGDGYIDTDDSDCNSAPSDPTLVSPSDGSITPTKPTLTATYQDSTQNGWTYFSLTSTSIDDCINGSNILYSGVSAQTSSTSENTTWAITTLSKGTYYWCARNYDGTLYSNWAGMGSFTYYVSYDLYLEGETIYDGVIF